MILSDLHLSFFSSYKEEGFEKFLAEKFLLYLKEYAHQQRLKWFPYTRTAYLPESIKYWNATVDYIKALKIDDSGNISMPNVSKEILILVKSNEFGTTKVIAKPLFRPVLAHFRYHILEYIDEFKKLRQSFTR